LVLDLPFFALFPVAALNVPRVPSLLTLLFRSRRHVNASSRRSIVALRTLLLVLDLLAALLCAPLILVSVYRINTTRVLLAQARAARTAAERAYSAAAQSQQHEDPELSVALAVAPHAALFQQAIFVLIELPAWLCGLVVLLTGTACLRLLCSCVRLLCAGWCRLLACLA
jgi:hypothetical protein